MLADALAAISKHFHKLKLFFTKGRGGDICFLNARPPSLHPTCEQPLIIIVSVTTQTGSSKVSPKTQLGQMTFPIGRPSGSVPVNRKFGVNG